MQGCCYYCKENTLLKYLGKRGYELNAITTISVHNSTILL